MKKVGFVGLGIMGKPMVMNLLKAGVEVTVYDLNEEAVRSCAEAGAVPGSLRYIGESCDVIFTSLPNGEIVQECIFGEDGLASALKEGAVICDVSSVTPTQSRVCYRRLKALGHGFVDCPMSGGEPGAVSGTLAFMAGGDEADFETVLPYLHVMGASAVLVGGPGIGSVTKLANQIIVNNTIAIVSEALVLAQKAGADPEKVYQAIRGGLAGSAVLDAKAPMMMDRNFVPGGKISINHKDIKNVVATAHELDVPIPYSAQLYEILQTLKIHGMMDMDHAAIVRYFETLADVEVKRKGEEREDE